MCRLLNLIRTAPFLEDLNKEIMSNFSEICSNMPFIHMWCIQTSHGGTYNFSRGVHETVYYW